MLDKFNSFIPINLQIKNTNISRDGNLMQFVGSGKRTVGRDHFKANGGFPEKKVTPLDDPIHVCFIQLQP